MKKIIFLLIVVVLSLSCSNSDNNPNNNNGNDFSENFGNVVNRNFIGQIIDENSQPIEGVEIKIGSIIKYTDSNGFFVIKNAEVYDKFAYITAKKLGFINGSRTLVPNSESNTIKIMMLTATVQATVESGTASNVTLSNGAKVTFDGNFKTETGASYSGSVEVMMYHLDPTDFSMPDRMPGSLLGDNIYGEMRALETFGMLNIELQDGSGNKLQIVNPSSIEMPISSSLSVSAPNTIPLWYFDETAGYWKEEGSATKVGNNYVGSVNHFSWWNCDRAFPMECLSLTIVNSNQVPLAGVRVQIVSNSYGYGRDGITNNLGQVRGFVPSNSSLTMTIYSANSVCGVQTIHTQQLAPLTNYNFNLQIVVTPPSSVITTFIQGTLKNCNNNNVTNGYVSMQIIGQYLYTQVIDGVFSFTVLNCSSSSNSFSLHGFDVDTNKFTMEQTGTLNGQTMSLGDIQCCSTNSNPNGGVTDIDQNSYTYIGIGQQMWMQQNLNVSRYSDGTVIPQVTDPSQLGSLLTGAWCYYQNNSGNGAIYGKLYNWYAVMGIYDTNSYSNPSFRKKLAPTGWHIPTNSEWDVLINYLGGAKIAGGKMKESGTVHWNDSGNNWNADATNESGFTGLPGGRFLNTFSGKNSFGWWWCSLDSNLSEEFYDSNYQYLEYSSGRIVTFYGQSSAELKSCLSVRCIKD